MPISHVVIVLLVVLLSASIAILNMNSLAAFVDQKCKAEKKAVKILIIWNPIGLGIFYRILD